MGGHCHDLLLAAVCIVAPAEGDATVFKGHETMVGDGHAMGVAGQVVENMFDAAERWLGVDHPVLAAEFLQELVECVRRAKLLKRAMELESVLLEELTKPGAGLTAEAPAERLNGQEEAWRGLDPSGAVQSQTAGGNDAVEVGMQTSAPTIPCSRKAMRSRFSILSIRFMVLPFRSSAGPSGEMAQSQSSIEAENG